MEYDKNKENSIRAGQAKDAYTAAIVLAAGRGRRMNSRIAKQYLSLGGKPLLFYSLKAFQDSGIEDVVLVVGAGEEDYARREIVEKYGLDKVRRIVAGGRERYFSVQNGLLAAGELADGHESYIFIHDGARPFLTEEIIERAYACAREEKACVVGMPVKDTVKIADTDGYIGGAPARERVWTAQTPQVFEYGLISRAYRKLMEEEDKLAEKAALVTDDAGVVELFEKRKIKLVRGSYENIKITTPEDLEIGEIFLKKFHPGRS